MTSNTNSIIADEDRSFVLKKIWCHGQSIFPPIIGIAFVVYACRESNHIAMSFFVFAVLCAWPFLSWKAIATAATASPQLVVPSFPRDEEPRTSLFANVSPYRLLRWGGIVVLAVYLLILFVATTNAGGSSGLRMLLTIFSGLAAIETVAFLLVVTCLRSIFVGV
eukprot:CAMPEP_0201125496 /NCGR_PEP_ID=MMETSP0850-20130426/21692_1 /ASSEMBLY_ACC=CAM_ASM_000622 /TAXON_ID=183588 /ORGANISM="Pseudo-nitzschia fraudulenta, Strain WWA7" /LENGTH=164 /DNA_ID=CAMNT_0047393545 /DNA_START=236 /DNA_END=730 /DNA_ORIENTATION=-